MRIRALRHGERGPVLAVFDGLSAHSRHRRFHQPTPKLSTSTLHALTDVDDHRHVAVVAEVEGPSGPQVIGMARMIATGDGVAEVAYAVVDAWHRRGVGRRLLTELRDRAVVLGHRRLVALVMLDNRAAAALYRSVFGEVDRRWVDGALELTAHLPISEAKATAAVGAAGVGARAA